MPTPGMLALRPVNLKIGNLSRHLVTEVRVRGRTLFLDFSVAGQAFVEFSVQLDGLVALIDRGVALRPLTAGIVWTPLSQSGGELASLAADDGSSLIELRLDFENASGLVSRFQAIGQRICVVSFNDADQDDLLLFATATDASLFTSLSTLP